MVEPGDLGGRETNAAGRRMASTLLHRSYAWFEVVLILSSRSADLQDDGSSLQHAVCDLLRVCILRQHHRRQRLHCIYCTQH